MKRRRALPRCISHCHRLRVNWVRLRTVCRRGRSMLDSATLRTLPLHTRRSLGRPAGRWPRAVWRSGPIDRWRCDPDRFRVTWLQMRVIYRRGWWMRDSVTLRTLQLHTRRRSRNGPIGRRHKAGWRNRPIGRWRFRRNAHSAPIVSEEEVSIDSREHG